MKRWIGVLLLGAMSALGSCRKGAPGAAPDASAPGEGGPSIRVEGTQVSMNGEMVGSTRAIQDLGRMQRVDDLFDRLKAARETFKMENPGTPFPGRATIAVPGDTTLLVFKSVFQTAAFAGYPNLLVDASPGLVPIQAIIPGPAAAPSPRVALHVGLLASAVTMIEKHGATVTHQDRVEMPASDAELGDRVGRAVVDHVLRRDVRALPVMAVILSMENGLPFAKLAAVLRGLRAAHERLAGPGDEDGAFVVRLSVR